ncbi:glycoside hydrolase family 15 protein [Candidatus Leptofilum sp.]|uniref:glycoside hydrolase family 15 protein n=1 Tax=Candidatus Leptofilum sp. TaxID=3241576 RepID=UPI003B5BEB54
MNLYQHSIQVLLDSQAESGAFIASHAFPSYQYSWFRDSSFVAYALCRVGHPEKARRYFLWSAQTIQQYGWKAEQAVARIQNGERLGSDEYLHTRYTAVGKEADGLWWDFQLDGFGTWLWALAEYVKWTGDNAIVAKVADELRLVHRYLSHLWQQPNYDCWEELSQHLHSYTLAAIHAGLCGAAVLLPELESQVAETTADIRELMLTVGVENGRFSKSFTLVQPPQSALQAPQNVFHDAVETDQLRHSAEASLIGIATPYNLFPADEPHLKATITQIEADLHRPNGGVYRYLGDTYYGGGEWVLLGAWLGWHYARNGRIVQAQVLRNWVEAQADQNGNLPEQVSDHLLAPDRFAEWCERWGAIAKPLAWSHAMYLILCEELKVYEQNC